MSFVIGADEVGTGAFCGPLVVCAVVAPEGWSIPGLTDSKKLTPEKRSTLRAQILELDPFVRVFLEWRSSAEIDERGLGTALKDAYASALRRAVEVEPEARIVVDGTIRVFGFNHESIPKADALIPAVSAASIVAKTSRDHWMTYEAHTRYPQYGHSTHMGYGSPEHIYALSLYGPSPIHRMSYAPIKRFAEAHFSSSKAA